MKKLTMILFAIFIIGCTNSIAPVVNYSGVWSVKYDKGTPELEKWQVTDNEFIINDTVKLAGKLINNKFTSISKVAYRKDSAIVTYICKFGNPDKANGEMSFVYQNQEIWRVTFEAERIK